MTQPPPSGHPNPGAGDSSPPVNEPPPRKGEPFPPELEREYYDRQRRLREVGDEGQERLRRSAVLVVGAGGLGAPALSYLASAGVGRLGICDFDRLEASNLHRQPIYSLRDAGRPKAELAARRLGELNPFVEVCVIPRRLTAGNAGELLSGWDMVLDCSDNFSTKFMLHDQARAWGIPLVLASIYQFDGQLMSFVPGREAGCLRCLWPEEPPAECVGSCAEVGVLGPVPGVFGCLQAMEALKLLLGLPDTLAERMLLLDLRSYRTRNLRRSRRPDCLLCGEGDEITSPTSRVHSAGLSGPGDTADKNAIDSTLKTDPEGRDPAADPEGDHSWPSTEAGAASVLPDPSSPLKDWLDACELDPAQLDSVPLAGFTIVDLRDPPEPELRLPESQPLISRRFRHFDVKDPPFQKSARVLLICEVGVRSLAAARRLRALGHEDCWSLAGGYRWLGGGGSAPS